MRFADAFLAEGIEPEPTDHDFLVTCMCGMDQRLDEMDIDDECDGLVLYDCTRCANSLVGIMLDGDATDLWLSTAGMTRRLEVGGHRRNGLLVGSKVDIALRPPDADDDLVFVPSTPNFFATLRNL